MEAVPPKFETLYQRAGALLEADPTAEQAIAALTAGGEIHGIANHGVQAGNREDEAAFVKALAESGDGRLLCLVCVWRGLTPDLPSMGLRKALLKLDPANRETELLLRGEGYQVRTIGSTMPEGSE